MTRVIGQPGGSVEVIGEHDPPVRVDEKRDAPFVVGLLKPEAVVDPVVGRDAVDVDEPLLELGRERGGEEGADVLFPPGELGRGCCVPGELAELLLLGKAGLERFEITLEGLLQRGHAQSGQLVLAREDFGLSAGSASVRSEGNHGVGRI